MNYEYKSANINYEVVGNGNVHIVFLHGWQGSIDSFKFICKHLKFDYKAMFIDFPPFGKSTEMLSPWTIFDYAEMVLEIIKKEKFENIILVGHSFGGRVATILSSNRMVKKLVLTSSAGLKLRRKISYYFKKFSNKVRAIFGKKKKGSKDYEMLSAIMKKTFVNIVSTFLDKYVIYINVPTLLFWGKKDTETPFYMAKKYKKLIKNSELVVCEKAGHFAYLQELNTFVAVLNSFVKN